MAYLKREDRYTNLIEAATKVALEHGLAAVTARRVAEEAGAATGHIHHHFASISDLKAAVLKHASDLVFQLIEAEAVEMRPRARLLRLLQLSSQGPESAHIRLWGEAVYLSEQDPVMGEACTQCFAQWHAVTRDWIVFGQAQEVFRGDVPASDAAWRLMAACMGFEGLAQFGKGLQLPDLTLAAYLETVVDLELAIGR